MGFHRIYVSQNKYRCIYSYSHLDVKLLMCVSNTVCPPVLGDYLGLPQEVKKFLLQSIT